MDRKELARKLREALFDHIEAGRREALQDEAVDRLFERVLASWGTLALGDIATRPLSVPPNASHSDLLAARKAEWDRISLEAFRSFSWPIRR